MNKMKESGIEWIGEIPREWKVLKSRYFLKEISLIGYPDEEVLSLYRDYGIVPKNSRSDNYNVTSLNTSGYKFVRPGYLVINKMKAWQGSMAISDFQGIVSPAYYTYEVDNTTFDLRFLHYALRNPAYNQEYRRISAGLRIGQWDLNKNEFKNLRYVYPIDKTVQKKIATFLDDKSVLIDEIISDTKKTIEELQEYKKSVITEVVTKGLDANVKFVPSGVEWIGEIPENWKVSKVKNISKLRNDKTLYEEGHEFLALEKMMSYKPGYVDLLTDIESGRQQVIKMGDVVFSKLRPYLAKVALSDFDGHGTSELLVFHNIKINRKFFMYKLISEQVLQPVRSASYGVKMPRVSPEFIMSLLISFPKLVSEQTEIVTYLDKQTEQIDTLIAEKENLISEYESYKKSTIYEYVTGKKQVED